MKTETKLCKRMWSKASRLRLKALALEAGARRWKPGTPPRRFVQIRRSLELAMCLIAQGRKQEANNIVSECEREIGLHEGGINGWGPVFPIHPRRSQARQSA